LEKAYYDSHFSSSDAVKKINIKHTLVLAYLAVAPNNGIAVKLSTIKLGVQDIHVYVPLPSHFNYDLVRLIIRTFLHNSLN
jgi:hypothetical protein